MNSLSPSNQDGDVQLSDSDFARIAKIAHDGWGLNLEESKRPLIRTRLGRRLRALDLSSFGSYCDQVEANRSNEQDNFIAALTTNVTNFYRELHHFEMLEKTILPRLEEETGTGGRIRIWSAGCSNGQEPYSISGSVLEAVKNISNYDLRILATDIDHNILAKAEAGKYKKDECSFPNPKLEKRIFSSPPNAVTATNEVKDNIKSLVTFRRLNLVGEWPFSGPFDVIFCRNVAIYFDKPTQERLWKRLAEMLTPTGHLFIGHSERIGDAGALGLNTVGITSFQKTGNRQHSFGH